MRTYIKLPFTQGGQTTLVWTVVSTDAKGNNDLVWLATLIQCLRLNLGESPFFSDHGIPARESIVTSVWPDYYVALTQQQFASYFISLSITRVLGATKPAYNVNVTLRGGQLLSLAVGPAGIRVLGTQSGAAITGTGGQEFLVT